MASMDSAMSLGMRCSTSKRPKAVAVNRISNTRPVIQVVVRSATLIANQRSSRCTNQPMNRV